MKYLKQLRSRSRWGFIVGLFPILLSGQTLAADFDTIALRDKYIGENEHCTQGQRETLCCIPGDGKERMVQYLSVDERKQYVLELVDGKLMQGGKLLPNLEQGADPNTEVEYLYSMDAQGTIYVKPASPMLTCKFHHSSFVAGAPLAGAGQIKIRQGKATFMDNCSGHYRPSDDIMDQVLSVLRQSNVEVERVRYYGGKRMPAPKQAPTMQ